MKTPNKNSNVVEGYTSYSIDDICESAFSSRGDRDADYDHCDYDVDNYAYEAY